MTVGELRKKLELYKDDVEIFVGFYDDCHGILTYNDMAVSQAQVDAIQTSQGDWYYERWGRKAKQHTILVIE